MTDLRLPRWGCGVTRSNTVSDGYCSPPKYLSELFMWPTVDSGFCCFPSNPAQTALVWSSLWSQMNWWIHHFGSVFWFSLWFRLTSRENTSFISRLTPLLRWPSHWNLDLHRTHFFLKFVNVSASCSAWGWWGVLSREYVGVLVGWEMGCKLTCLLPIWLHQRREAFQGAWLLNSKGACSGHSQLLPRSLLKIWLLYKVRGRKRAGLVTNSLGSSANAWASFSFAWLVKLCQDFPLCPHSPQELLWCTL